MRKTQVALAAMALVASTAVLADGVKLSGSLDYGLMSATNGASKLRGGGGDFNGLSNWAITGSHDLDNGMKADFNIVSTINAQAPGDTGGATSQDFGLIANNVGIGGEFGHIALGRVTIASFAATCATDPAGCSNTGSAVSYITAFRAGNGTTGTGRVGANVFESNTIQYTKEFGGLKAQIGYVNGNNTTDSSYGNKVAIGLTYTDGPLTVSGGNYRQTSATATTTEQNNSSIGIAYDVGMAVVKANYLSFKDDNRSAAIDKVTVTGVGADWKLGGGLTLNTAYYSSTTETAGTNASVKRVGLSYAVSKTASLYLNHVQADNNGARIADAYGGLASSVGTIGNGVSGQTAKMTVAGMIYNF